ncbi:hypothetical protein PV327_011415 [Microctonus hyperodae]|uniref:F-box domain-containing protein n=1 Tax=Microctonus hyperodae TaxID=165561 RepID=A0AA39FIZ5_MICHY|nr:hypothetical protein PV327_011415 [Microctonus hyperodae]
MRAHSEVSLSRTNMEKFLNMMGLMDALPNLTDFVDILPVEISQIILRYLDGRSLLNAVNVSRKWRDVCRGDPQLRRTARNQIQEDRRLKIKTMRGKRPYEYEEIAEKYKKTSASRVATTLLTTPECTFSGDSTGLDANLTITERNVERRIILRPKRSINRIK